MKSCVLGSGSKGNSIFVKTRELKLLVDAGLSCRQLELRLKKIGQDPSDIDLILVTHEHSDHVGGISRFVKLHGPKVYANNGTLTAMKTEPHVKHNHIPFVTGQTFTIEDTEITPLPVSHNAADPVCFHIESNGKKLGILTDLGFVSNNLINTFNDLDVLFIESNYDPDILLGSRYPVFLKKRISGLSGHLSNASAAEAILKINPSPKTHLVLTHLSQNNNHPDIAYSCVRELMETNGISGKNLSVSSQDEPTRPFSVWD